jgi:hypothetical protein
MIACCNIWNALPYDMVILFKIILTFPNYSLITLVIVNQ